jgi:hypothetical protein
MPTFVAVALACSTVLALAAQQPDAAKAAARAGAIRGRLSDKHGSVLPGVTVSAASADLRKTAVTDAVGKYELNGLPAGVYTVIAALAGFTTGVVTDVTVRDSDAISVDFTLCAASLEFIDWIVPSDLQALWTQAAVVARVEIAATRTVAGECPSRDFEHTATIREVLKDNDRRIAGLTLTFTQPNWSGERTPYAVGQQMIVFLGAGPDDR